MSGYDLYIFILCLIVFTELTLLFGFMLRYIIKQAIKAIRHGLEDERIKIEYEKEMRVSPLRKKVDRIVTLVLLVLIFSLFATSISVHLVQKKAPGSLPIPKVVLSSSMEFKHEKNAYQIAWCEMVGVLFISVCKICFAESFQFGDALGCCKPYDLKVDRAVFMGNVIAHAANLVPRNVRILCFEIRR